MRADSQIYPLATLASATGAGVPIRGGAYSFLADGTPGGSTVSLQIQLLDASWCDVGALAGSAIVKSAVLPYVASPITLPACNVRCAMTGGAPSGINATLAGIDVCICSAIVAPPAVPSACLGRWRRRYRDGRVAARGVTLTG